jgi:hypothetical protein
VSVVCQRTTQRNSKVAVLASLFRVLRSKRADDVAAAASMAAGANATVLETSYAQIGQHVVQTAAASLLSACHRIVPLRRSL